MGRAVVQRRARLIEADEPISARCSVPVFQLQSRATMACGIDCPRDNLLSDSNVAVDAETGERL